MELKLSRTHLSNKKLEIYSSDCPQLWSKYPERHSIYGPKDIDYSFNSLGFRCDEFNIPNQNSIVFMGCSHTMGLGIPYYETWAYKLHQYFAPNTPYWNLGFEKSSIDAQVLLLKDLASDLKPNKIFFLMPNLYRRYIKAKDTILHYSPMIGQDKKIFDPKNNYEKFNIDKLEVLLLDQSFAFFQVELYLSMLDLIAKKYQTTVYLQHWYLTKPDEKILLESLINRFTNIIQLKTEWEIKDFARDKIHFGPESHTIFSSNIKKEFNNF